jgi:signal transduction histidine kinase
MDNRSRPEISRVAPRTDDDAPPRPRTGASFDPADPDSSRVRWAFLAEASRCLADSLDYEATLETVAGLALPLLGSWSIVDLVADGDAVRRVAIVHPDPAKQAIARELKSGWPPRRDDPVGVAAVVTTAKSELIVDISDEFLSSVARSEDNLSRLRELGMRSAITAPVAARGRMLGAITFIASTEDRRFTAADLSLAEELAARCGLAIDNARLHRAAQALVESERARLSTEAADRVKADFLRTVSHELRTPLNVMAGYLELLAMEIAGPLTMLQLQYVGQVQAGGEQLLRIIEDMLNFVRIHDRQIQYNCANIALRPVVEDFSAAYRRGLEKKGLELETRYAAGLRAHTDPAKVWQILMNLLSNARKFTAPGGTITIECGSDRGRPTIRVIDNGCGIPPDKLDAVFEPFAQADGGLTRPAEGMGLGLSISRQLARDMGGDLTATSTVGEGCTFVVTLARVQEG